MLEKKPAPFISLHPIILDSKTHVPDTFFPKSIRLLAVHFPFLEASEDAERRTHWGTNDKQRLLILDRLEAFPRCSALS